jgi:hypothetical protein
MASFEFKLKMWMNQKVTRRYGGPLAPAAVSIAQVRPHRLPPRWARAVGTHWIQPNNFVQGC